MGGDVTSGVGSSSSCSGSLSPAVGTRGVTGGPQKMTGGPRGGFGGPTPLTCPTAHLPVLPGQLRGLIRRLKWCQRWVQGGGVSWGTHQISPVPPKMPPNPTSFPDQRLLPLSTLWKPESSPPRGRRGHGSSGGLRGENRAERPPKPPRRGQWGPPSLRSSFTMLGRGGQQPRLPGT